MVVPSLSVACLSGSVRLNAVAADPRDVAGRCGPRGKLHDKNRPLARLLCDGSQRGGIAVGARGCGIQLRQVECAATLFRDPCVAPEQAEQAAPQAELRERIGRHACRRARCESGLVAEPLQRAGDGVDPDAVAVAHTRQRAARQRLGADVDHRRHLAGGAGHAPVGHQRHLVAGILQRAQHRGQPVQFGHAVGIRPLETHHRDQVAAQLARIERGLQRLLRIEHPHRGFDHAVLRRHRRDLDHAAAQVALHQPQAALGGERRGGGRQHLRVAALCGAVAPAQHAVRHHRFLRVTGQARTGHGLHVLVQQPGLQQLADHEAGAPGGMEMVHIGRAIGIDPRQQRRDARQQVKVVPVDDDAGGARHRHQMDGVVGRPAGGQQADHGIGDGAFVDDARQRQVAVAARAQRDRALRRRGRQRIAQAAVGMDEGRARQVQAHDLHQELVAVGGAVEGTGAGAVIGLAFGFQQRIAPDLAGGVELAYARLFLVGQPAGHRTRRDEHHRQVAELERAHQQARHDLVAHAQHQRRIEGVVRQRHRGAHGNRIAREQRQLHAGVALRDAVAHRRHAARHLRHRADRARGLADHRGIALIGLVRRQHVVVRGDDAKVGRMLDAQLQLVAGRQRGKAVRQVGARHAAQRAQLRLRTLAAGKVGGTAGAAARNDAVGNGLKLGMDGGRHGVTVLGGGLRHGGPAPLRRRRP
ncbi:conserved exported protein of unknown function [Cupriavidus taiwanensis]|uniref:Uncharacterized protein n=1 Tax=Cupriavidus taiwanensis TaxID=164546 RepID=A0A375IHY9_9BURK|nr:conserved exported protein of unknown function [Cupriavidus taiwanensis]